MKKKILFGLGIIIALILIEILITFIISTKFNNKYEITTDFNKYNNVITGEKWGLSEEIFPKRIKNYNVEEFKHVYYDPWDANYLAYLVIDYNEKEYKEEINRLSNLGIKKYVGFYGVTGFTNYQLIAMEADYYNGFVYAITDGKSKIIYVELIFCNYYMDIVYEKQIPKDYLPDGFDASINNEYQKKMMENK